MKKQLIFAAAALVLAGCSNDESTDYRPVAAQITAGVSGPATRAIDQTWEQDAIGVRVTGVTGTTEGVTSVMQAMYQNVKYTTNSSAAEGATFTSTDGIFFQDENETVTFAAYGPYQPSTDIATLPGTDGVITGISTASQDTREAQKEFDFIYASGATGSRTDYTVEFKDAHQFQHKMTRLIVIVKTSAADGFDETDVEKGTYTLTGLNHTGQFNVTTGTAEATGTAQTEPWSLTANSLMTAGETTQRTFTSILYPQTLSGSLTFTASIDGQTYTNAGTANTMQPALEAGYSYTYTITVKKQGLEISGCTIEAWSTGTGGSIDATMSY